MLGKFKEELAARLFGKPDPNKPYCAFNCENPSHDWKDDLSRREFHISGLCQNCQEVMFDEED